MDETRRSLIEQVGQHQPDAWQEFVAVYAPFIRGYLHRVGIREADIDDVQQDVMHVLARELPGFQHNQRTGAFRTWLRNIVANRLSSFRRSNSHRIQAVGGSEFVQVANQLKDESSDLSRIWDAEHQQHVVQSLIQLVVGRFNENTITAFRETFLYERSIDEVAAQMDMSVNAVVIARCRVLKKLRELGEDLLD